MGLIRIQNVTKQFGGRVVLDDVSLELHAGEIVGLVGPNGAGKTTLFKLVAGMLAPDMGTVTRSKGLDVGYLSQEPQVELENTLHDEVASVFADLLALERRMHALSDQIAAEHEGPHYADLLEQYDRVNAQFEAAGGYTFEHRLQEILGGLGFSTADYQLPMRAMSGGQKCRAALSKLLLQDRSFLLLDEPTNHLDIDAVRWLERFLAGHHGGAVIISHDRYLLDRVADRIVELERSKVTSYPGNYTNYVETRELRRLTQERQFEKDRAFIEKERTYIAKYLAGQRSQQAKGRRTRLERMLKDGEFTLDRPSDRKQIRMEFDAEVEAGRTTLELRDVSKRFGEKALLNALSVEIRAGQRVGITGPNGTGKSTLLKIALGLAPADAGTIHLDRKAVVGYYAQEAVDLDPNHTILAEIRETRPDYDELQARNMLARFLFAGDDVFKRIGDLSGGEQSRVRLLKLILQRANVLILDEPTNHLDIPSREVLEEALNDFPGTIITVSHDRYFLDQIVDRLLVLRDGRHAAYNGNYTYYLEQVEQAAATAPETADEKPSKSRAGAGAASRPAPAKLPRSKFDKMTMEQLEAYIMEGEAKVAVLNGRFADPAVYQDRDRVVALRAEFDALKVELNEAEQVWSRKIDEA